MLPSPNPGETSGPSLQGRAADDLRFIRETMERAVSFTALPGWGVILMGATALLALVAVSGARSAEEWFLMWMGEAVVAALVGFGALVRRSRADGVSLFRGNGGRFLFGMGPPLLAGGILGIALQAAGHTSMLPGAWLLMYGTALIAGGQFSVRLVSYMGASFMGLGVLALCAPASWGDVFMGVGFGGLHVFFGVCIRRSLDG